MNGTRKRGHHHGHLKTALIEATDAILREKGIEGFTLRAAARRAGVSPGAPAHHFGNVAGLMTEVTLLAYEELERYLGKVDDTGSPASRMRSLTTAYVLFALDHPARFRLMFRKDLVNRDDERYQRVSQQALLSFGDGIATLNGNQGLEDMKAKGAWGPLIAAWSTAHGIAYLAIENKFETILEGDPREAFLNHLLPDILLAEWPDQNV